MAGASSSKATSDGAQLTYNETIDVLCGFLKTAIHTILCHRQVYPPNVFTRRQRYRVPVWASRHPGLTTYIDDVINATKAQIERSALRSVHVVLTSMSSGKILERYRFDLLMLLTNVQPRDRNVSIPGNMTVETIELHLRAFMMKLISLDGALNDIENADDVTWAVVLDMKDGTSPQTCDKSCNEPAEGPWVPFEERALSCSITGSSKDQAQSSSSPSSSAAPHTLSSLREGDERDSPFILPVKSLDTGVINLMLYVEEHPMAKRNNQAAGSGAAKSISNPRSQKRAHLQKAPIAESIRIGERDIDAPLPQSSSIGAFGNRTAKSMRKQSKMPPAGGGTRQEDDDEALSSDSSSGSNGSSSGDSLRSVNDFAGYGKGAGSVGMSGVGM